MSLRATSQILNKTKKLLRKSKLLLENVNNKSPLVVRSGKKSCQVNMTVLLSFQEKTDDTYAAHNRHTVPLSSRSQLFQGNNELFFIVFTFIRWSL